MCGIVGAVGKIGMRDFLINGLSSLDYRGYDSAGVAYFTNNQVSVIKTKGSVDYLSTLIPDSIISEVGIGHTRWATHGEPNDVNSHPQVSMHKSFYIVHNGVIENYRSLKNKLCSLGYHFVSETDTEVIANLLDYYYLQNHDVLDAIYQTIGDLQGSYALVIINSDYSDRLYFAKSKSPLLIGITKNATLLASDAVPMTSYTDEFVDLDDYQYGFVTGNNINIFLDKNFVDFKVVKKSISLLKKDLCGYPHFMLKEIEEIPHVINRICDNYFDGEHYLFDENMIKVLKDADSVIFIACGTSYHAALVGKNYLRYAGIKADCFVASEWAYYPMMTGKRPVFILLSQSGETADVIRCLNIIDGNGFPSIAITNTYGSTLNRRATFSCLLYCGLEVSVASTKVYQAQVSLLSLITGALTDGFRAVYHLKETITSLEGIINAKEKIHNIAKIIKDQHDVYFIGRGVDYYISLEASLKLKEITYIHSEAIPAGELKHGPIALIEKGTPVFGFVSDSTTDAAIRSNFDEVKARGGNVFVITSSSLKKDEDAFYIDDCKTYLAPLTKAMFGQYLAYYVAVEKGTNVDKPRNLAKSVTVE